MNDNLLNELNDVLQGGKIRYAGATVSKSQRSIVVRFITDVAVDGEKREKLSVIVKKYIPQSFDSVKIEINKIVALDEFVKTSVVKYLKDAHRIAFSVVTENDVEIKRLAGSICVNLKLESTIYEFFISKNVASEVKNFLEKSYVDNFSVSAEDIGSVKFDKSILSYTDDKDPAPHIRFRRQLKVDEVTRFFDDDATRTATYIADTDGMLGEVYIAGAITSIREQTSKNDNLFYIIEVSDRTGMISGMIFPNKDKLPKMKKLAVGVEIIIRGEFEMRGEYRNLRIKSINLCTFPANFVPEERPKKPVPKDYYLIKPQTLVIEKQDNFLEEKPIPECFIGRNFVVFDLETTGTDFDDVITEIGAVRIADGKLTEYFTTLINPHKHIPAEVTKITGIDDEMVADAPDYTDVCPDFYKFCHGATLVAHNMDFDSRFIKRQSAPLDYYFDNPLLDTLALARESITGVANYKLNTLCDKFGIVFRHHRALSDAIATAELLIEIIRIRKSLPF